MKTPSPSTPTKTTKELKRDLQKEQAEKGAYLKNIELRSIQVAKTVLGENGIFGEVENRGSRTLSEVEITVYCLDRDGKTISEETYHPVLKSKSRWSSRDYMPLRPKYFQPFGYKISSTSEWSGKVRLEVSGIEFEDKAVGSFLWS